MDEIKKYIKILDNIDITSSIQDLYSYAKKRLKKNMTIEEFESFFKAYLIHNMSTKKEIFNFCDLKETLNNTRFLKMIVYDFIIMINATKAKISELIDDVDYNELKDLEDYINDPMYKELSEKDQIIGMIIKDEFCYVTIGDIKTGSYLTNGHNIGKYTLSKEEIEKIEEAYKFSHLNELAHLIFDDRIDTIYEYKEDTKDKDIMRKLIINTGKHNPEYEILFKDGTIINYRNGYFRKKPYNYFDLINYTKLYLIANYYEIEEDIGKYMDFDFESIDPELFEIIKFQDEIETAFSRVVNMLYSLEDVYTKKMIDNSKEEYTKVKKILKDYNL